MVGVDLVDQMACSCYFGFKATDTNKAAFHGSVRDFVSRCTHTQFLAEI